MFRKKNESQDVYIYNFKFSENGLTTEEALKRLSIYGQNSIIEKKKMSALSIFLNQFKDFIVLVLFAAATISVIMGENADAVTITAIIILNGIMGFVQEYRTEKSMEALKELTAPTVRVMRDGVCITLPSIQIVPDDIILLEAGDRVPADSMLIEAYGIQVDESLLTGESVPVNKKAFDINNKKYISKNSENMVFMGTIITAGRGKAVVISTGMATEMGKIADILQNVKEEQTPLQRKLDRAGKIMVYCCILACIVVTVTGILKGENIYTMFLTGVSLAVAAIPEGLPAIVTVSLTLGVQRMLKRNALIRRLPAVETLGCTDVICSDKTGTLTENKMTIKYIYYDGEMAEVSGSGYETEGKFIRKGRIIDPRQDNILKLFLEASVSCSNSSASFSKPYGKVLQLKNYKKEAVSVSGDPTEIAFIICAHKAGIMKAEVDKKYIRVGEIGFDSERKRMSVIVKYKGEYYVFIKGAVDVILDLCSNALLSNGIKDMNVQLKNSILKVNDRMAKEALRVLAVAYKKLPYLPYNLDEKTIESELVFLGIAGMFDPPRKEAINAIDICKIAGIKPVMITGDHKETAVAIAKQLKLIDDNSSVLTGKDIDNYDDKTLSRIVEDTAVFARVTPKHKIRIVKAYKNKGHIVAMTGDGVNDAPAVKEADIGVSMGISGTDVTKEASSMVLLDDNFATIVAAVEEGRVIYDNIRKFIRYLLSCNLGEVLTMFFASLLGFPIPLLPIQILWVNLVTDGLPAIALGVDPPDSDIMLRKPRKKDESIFSNGLAFRIIFRGLLMGLCTLLIFSINLRIDGQGLTKARTMAFATIVLSQLIHVFECRSERHSIFEINFFSNIYLILAVLISVFMLCIAIYLPILKPVFETSSLSAGDWIEVLFFSGAISIIVNVRSYIKAS